MSVILIAVICTGLATVLGYITKMYKSEIWFAKFIFWMNAILLITNSIFLFS